jgi:hypothetical protein
LLDQLLGQIVGGRGGFPELDGLDPSTIAQALQIKLIGVHHKFA